MPLLEVKVVRSGVDFPPLRAFRARSIRWVSSMSRKRYR